MFKIGFKDYNLYSKIEFLFLEVILIIKRRLFASSGNSWLCDSRFCKAKAKILAFHVKSLQNDHFQPGNCHFSGRFNVKTDASRYSGTERQNAWTYSKNHFISSSSSAIPFPFISYLLGMGSCIDMVWNFIFSLKINQYFLSVIRIILKTI